MATAASSFFAFVTLPFEAEAAGAAETEAVKQTSSKLQKKRRNFMGEGSFHYIKVLQKIV
jgi:hypothetical protein